MSKKEEGGKLGKPSQEVGAKLTTLGLKILDAALGDFVSFESRLDAFKIVANYYVGVSRVKRNPDDETDGDDSMEALKRELASK